MSDNKKKMPLHEVLLNLDVGGATELKKFRFRGKNEVDVAFQVGKFIKDKKLDKAELLNIELISSLKPSE